MSASDLEPFLPDWIEAAAEEARSVALGMLRERGRGAVLVGVARVDAALEALLKAAQAPPRGSESLFHTDRPLGSFGAKIALAARLGLIDAAVEQSLHNLRRVRNAPTAALVDDDVGDRHHATRRLDSVEQPVSFVTGLQQLQPVDQLLLALLLDGALIRASGRKITPGNQSLEP